MKPQNFFSSLPLFPAPGGQNETFKLGRLKWPVLGFFQPPTVSEKTHFGALTGPTSPNARKIPPGQKIDARRFRRSDFQSAAAFRLKIALFGFASKRDFWRFGPFWPILRPVWPATPAQAVRWPKTQVFDPHTLKMPQNASERTKIPHTTPQNRPELVRMAPGRENAISDDLAHFGPFCGQFGQPHRPRRPDGRKPKFSTPTPLKCLRMRLNALK